MGIDVTRTMAVVLGGGTHGGLWPLTDERSKPAVPFGARYRLIDVTISNCINSKIPRIFVLTQYNSESLNRHINLTYRFDYFTQGFVEILAAEQREDSENWFKGSANAVRHAWLRLERHEAQQLLVLPGDHVYKLDYRDLLDFHQHHAADITLLAAPVGRAAAHRYGLLNIDKRSTIVDFVEKPDADEVIDRFQAGYSDRYLANTGIYLFRCDKLRKLLDDENCVDIGTHVIPKALAEGLVVKACPLEGPWENMGSIKSYFDVNLQFAGRRPPFSLYDPAAPIYTNPRFLPGAKMFSCNMSNTLVADGCVLENADIHDCVIGPRGFVRAGTSMKQVVMMGADFFEKLDQLAANRREGRPHVGVGHHTHIERAILDKDVRIGNHVHIINRDQLSTGEGPGYVIRDGLVVIRKGAVIPDGTVI